MEIKYSTGNHIFPNIIRTCFGRQLHKDATSVIWIGRKIYQHIGNGVQTIDIVTGERRFISNNWYTDERLENILGLSNKTKIKSR